MGKIITQCPACKSSNLNVVKIECSDCNTRFEGQFEISALLKLPEDDLQFILDFVKCSGSLKDMAAIQKVSYPTLRNRLNALIENLENMEIKKKTLKKKFYNCLRTVKLPLKMQLLC